MGEPPRGLPLPERTSTPHAPWYVIPSNHKWFRDLAISQIIADTLDVMGLKLPPTQVDIAAIRRKYDAAAIEQERQDRRGSTGTRRAKAVAEKK